NSVVAEREYTAVLAEAYGKLGKVYSAEKKYQPAITTLESATHYQPDSLEYLIDLAIAYFDAEQFEKALEPLGKALSVNPQSAGAHHMLGKSYFMLGDFDKSAKELQTALKITPNDDDIAYTLGLAYLKQHQFPPAQQIYERMLGRFGDRPQLRIVFGRAYRETERYLEAIEVLRKSIALNPSLSHNDYQVATAHYRLGQSLLKAGQNEAAQKELQVAAELKSNSLKRDKEKNEIYLSAANLH